MNKHVFRIVLTAAIGFAFLAGTLVQAQSLSGDFRNTTVNIAKGTDGDMALNVQVGDDGQPAVTGGVTVKGGDTVQFDNRGSLKTKTAGFWKGKGMSKYKVLFRDQSGNSLLIVELQGEVRWNSDRNVFQGAENFLRLTTKGDNFIDITNRETKNGRLVITAKDGSVFTLYNFSCDFSGTASSFADESQTNEPPETKSSGITQDKDLIVTANAYYDQQDYEKAFISFYQAATNGSVIGQLNAGVMYRKGTGVQQNPDEAFKWLLKAAGASNAEAEYDVGMMLATGEGTQRDEAQAKQWMQKSAAAGFSEAVEYLKNANLKPLNEGKFVGTAEDGSELNITLEKVEDSIKVKRLGYKFAGSMRVVNVSMPTKEPFGTFTNNTLTFQFPVMISFAMQNFQNPSANVGVATYTALLKNDGINVICELERADKLLPEYESLKMEQISMEGQMPDGTRMLHKYQIIFKPNGQ